MACPISEERKQQWKEDILNQYDSGLSVAEWCRRNKIAAHNFYYWQKKLFPKAHPKKLAFAEIKEKGIANDSDSGVILECQGVTIRLTQKFMPSTLKTCLLVLKEC
jgi:hypothetical protein